MVDGENSSTLLLAGRTRTASEGIHTELERERERERRKEGEDVRENRVIYTNYTSLYPFIYIHPAKASSKHEAYEKAAALLLNSGPNGVEVLFTDKTYTAAIRESYRVIQGSPHVITSTGQAR